MATNPAGKIIDVTAETIEISCRANSSHCMVAESIKASWPWARYVSVDLQTIRVSDMERRERISYLTPRKVQLAIIEFDQGRAVAPFSFTLRSPHYSPTAARQHVEPYKYPLKAKLPTELMSRAIEQPKITTRAVPGGGTTSTETRSSRPLPGFRIGRRRQFGIKSLEP